MGIQDKSKQFWHVKDPPRAKEGVFARGADRRVTTQVWFFFPLLGVLGASRTKSPLVLRQIVPSALGIPAEPSPLHRSLPGRSVRPSRACARLSLSPPSPNILLWRGGGDEDRFVCVITPALSARAFGDVCRAAQAEPGIEFEELCGPKRLLR